MLNEKINEWKNQNRGKIIGNNIQNQIKEMFHKKDIHYALVKIFEKQH